MPYNNEVFHISAYNIVPKDKSNDRLIHIIQKKTPVVFPIKYRSLALKML